MTVVKRLPDFEARGEYSVYFPDLNTSAVVYRDPDRGAWYWKDGPEEETGDPSVNLLGWTKEEALATLEYKLRELIDPHESNPRARKLYHVTTAENADSILQQGILAMHPTRWKTRAGKRYGGGEIYAMESLPDAIRWASRMDWESNQALGSGNIVIVTFVDSEPWHVDEADPLSQLSYEKRWLKKEGHVPPENIREISPLTEDMARTISANPRRPASLPIIHPGAKVQVIDDSLDPPRWVTLAEVPDTPRHIQEVLAAHDLKSAWARDALGDRRMVHRDPAWTGNPFVSDFKRNQKMKPWSELSVMKKTHEISRAQKYWDSLSHGDREYLAYEDDWWDALAPDAYDMKLYKTAFVRVIDRAIKLDLV